VKDPVFRSFSFSTDVCQLVEQLGLSSPVVPQSMYIVKGPRVGGEVRPHRDSTFLFTDPLSCVGLWWALEDARVDNACLWAVPGSHLTNPSTIRRFVLTEERDGTEMVGEDEHYDDAEFVPIECDAGSLVILHGSVIHRSSQNRSDRSRHAYSIHVVDGAAKWSTDNWISAYWTDSFPSLRPSNATE